MIDKTKIGLGMRRDLILALEGVRASGFREKKKPFLWGSSCSSEKEGRREEKEKLG